MSEEDGQGRTQFWPAFWEGMNPAYWLAWLLYGLGGAVSRLMNLWEPLGYLYPVYNRLMLWSLAVQRRFGLSGPWQDGKCHDGSVQP